MVEAASAVIDFRAGGLGWSVRILVGIALSRTQAFALLASV
jgi:hypothetical protein